MASTPHLLVALSGHGFGHLAQVAPVVRELRRRRPLLRLTVQGTLPEALLRDRIGGEFGHIAQAADVGMVMASALDVRIEQSLAAYYAFHADWPARLERWEDLLERLAPDLVLADIPYLPLAAAARRGIPAVALCSLHWADIVQGYGAGRPEMEPLRAVMLEAYRSAAVFLRPAPSMPMPDLTNTRAIGPIAALGSDRRTRLNERLNLAGDETLVLAALGGVDLPLPLARWPVMPGYCWLIPPGWGVARADVRSWKAVTELSFTDLLCSCDMLLTKPGYGSFTEAVCNGKPVLFVERDDWPETPCLVDWLLANGNAVAVARESLESGALLPALRALRARPPKPVPAPSGIGQAADCLEAYLPG